MNKWLLAVVVIAVGVGVGWYYVKGTGSTNTSSGTPKVNQVSPTASGTSGIQDSTSASGGTAIEGSAVVTYTDTGFSPKSVTVKKGTTVTFQNEGIGKMWVASGVHPTHQLLPGFDELTSVQNGGSYDYTFVKVGTWQYHNHVKPSDLGIVVVTE